MSKLYYSSARSEVYRGQDQSYLDVQTRTELSDIKKAGAYRITNRYPRSKLAADGTRFGAGSNIVTPKDIRGELIAWYGTLEREGICQNVEGFKDKLVVQLNNPNPNRLLLNKHEAAAEKRELDYCADRYVKKKKTKRQQT